MAWVVPLLLATSLPSARGLVKKAAVSEDLAAGVQAAMLLGAMLPEHGAGPSPEAEKEMAQAGAQLYRGYELLQSASGNVVEVRQQLRTHRHMEEMWKSGAAAIQEGQRLRHQAEASLQAEAEKNP